MTFDKDDMLKKALEAAKKEELVYVEEVITYLPISKATFYSYFPLDSDGLNAIKEILETNIVNRKQRLVKKWEKSDNATLEVVAFKLLATEDQLRRINPPKDNSKNENVEIIIKRED